jgi:phosphoglycolate phosphatase
LETEDPQKLSEGLKVLEAYYREHCVDQTLVFPGVFELLDYLKGRGAQMGLVSNKPHEFTLITLEKLKLMPYFGVALGADATEFKKPHPGPLREALKRLGAEARDSVMIGDSPVDAQAAKAVPMRVGLVTHGFVDPVYLKESKADWEVESLKDFIEIFK